MKARSVCLRRGGEASMGHVDFAAKEVPFTVRTSDMFHDVLPVSRTIIPGSRSLLSAVTIERSRESRADPTFGSGGPHAIFSEPFRSLLSRARTPPVRMNPIYSTA